MTMKHSLQWLRGRRASVTLLAAVIFPALVGMAGLATEYGNALLIKVKAQRIADAAAYGAAWAYSPANSSDTNTSAMNAAANRIALLNGIVTSDMAVSIGNSPSGDGNQAVRATVTMGVAVDLTKLINGGSQLSVTANAYVELKNDTLACIIAVKSGGTGVTLSGGGKITANTCGVASAATTTSPAAIVAPNGTTVTTPQVTTPQALTTSQEANIQPPAGTGAVTYKVKPVTDPLAGNAEVTTAVSRLSTVAALTNPSAPSLTGGTNWSPGFTGPATTASVGGCSETESAGWSGVWTVTCSGAGPFNFATLDMSGASSVTFTGNNASAIYNFNGKVNTGSATVTFNGAGTYNILAGLNVGGGSTTKFTSPATFNIGPNSSCNGGNYSICNTGALLSFAGPSTFVLSNGLYNGGGETMVLGSGSTSNSYQIGSSSDGNAINMGGGSFVTLNDATGAGDVFTANGNISNGGGSCLALPAATQHDINGSIILGGGATLGGGIYTIYDYLALGSAGGGAVTCGGQSIGMKASGVSLIIGGNATLPCGSSSSYVFCITGGYTNVTLTAPSIGSTVNLAVVGPTVSGITAGAILTAGASGANITGAFYFPYGTFSMSGGASVGGGGCLELIAAQIAITQGTAVGSTCVGLAANPQKIVLVQ